jgi:dihydrofolate reductase
MSLDGVIQGPGGPQEDTTGGFDLGGWSATQWDKQMEQIMAENIEKPFDLLLGRFTYDIWAPYWPTISKGSIAEKFNRINKYVATQTLKEATWQGTTLLNGDVIGQIKLLRNSQGVDLQMYGSSKLIQSLLQHALIDEMNIWIFPLVLGKGKKLFAEGTVSGNFKLTRHTMSSTGVFIGTYEPAGAVPLGHAGESNQ